MTLKRKLLQALSKWAVKEAIAGTCSLIATIAYLLLFTFWTWLVGVAVSEDTWWAVAIVFWLISWGQVLHHMNSHAGDR